MPQVCIYDPDERELEKDRSRASDADALRLGAVCRRDLRGRNGFFASLEIAASSVACQEEFA